MTMETLLSRSCRHHVRLSSTTTTTLRRRFGSYDVPRRLATSTFCSLHNHRLPVTTTPRHTTTMSPSCCSSRLFSTSTANTKLKIPPNLIIDPKSSFAPVPLEEDAHQEEAFDTSEEAEEDKDASVEAASDAEQSTKASAEGEVDVEEEEDDFDEDEEEQDLYIPEPEVQYAVPLPDRLHVPVHTLFAPQYDSQVGTIWLDETVFGQEPIRVDLLKRAVNYIRAKKRGKKKSRTKTINEVSGSGRKVRQQKGTGMARAGHSRPPHWRKGAKAHGPKGALTDYAKTKLNNKVRRLALCHALSQKLLEGNLIILNQVHDTPTVKTNQMSKYLEPWDIGRKRGPLSLLADHYVPEEGEEAIHEETGEPIQSKNGLPVNFVIPTQNIPRLTVCSDRGLNVYRILKHQKLILTLSAVQMLEGRLSAS